MWKTMCVTMRKISKILVYLWYFTNLCRNLRIGPQFKLLYHQQVDKSTKKTAVNKTAIQNKRSCPKIKVGSMPYSTIKLPVIPAALWPGIEQKKL